MILLLNNSQEIVVSFFKWNKRSNDYNLGYKKYNVFLNYELIL